MSLPVLPRNVETVSFLFCLDTKWQNVAPVGWFNSNKQASLPCQRADWKRQPLFGFNQKCQHFQCDISDSKVCELCICLGWRWGWSVGHHLGGFLCTLLIYFFSTIGGEKREERAVREGEAQGCCLSDHVFGVCRYLSHVGRSAGKRWLGVVFSQELFPEGTYSPR